MGYGSNVEDEENPPVPDDEKDEVAEKRKLKPIKDEDIELTKIPVKTKDGKYPEVIAGQEDPLIKAHHLKYLLLGFNFFLTVLGLVLLSLSIWVLVDPAFWEFESALDVDHFPAVCIMLIVSSIVILVVGFLGCFGAATEKRWILVMYIGIFGVVFLLELAAVVIMWSAPYSKTIQGELEKQLEHQINDRSNGDASRKFMDFIQNYLECCGATSFHDYKGEPAPNSCQDEMTGNLYNVGCATKMLSYLRSKAGILGGVALPILLVQLLALLASGCLIKSLDVESRYFM
jgi:tetraspanin-1